MLSGLGSLAGSAAAPGAGREQTIYHSRTQKQPQKRDSNTAILQLYRRELPPFEVVKEKSELFNNVFYY